MRPSFLCALLLAGAVARAEDAPAPPRPLWPFSVGEQWGYLDRDGRVAIPARFGRAEEFVGGLARVKTGETWSYIDSTGRTVEPEGIPGVYPEGLEPYRDPKTGKYGYRDRLGKTVIEPKFDSASPHAEGLARVSIEIEAERKDDSDFEFLRRMVATRSGYIDREGRWVLEPKFAGATNFSEGLAAVGTGQWGYVDRTGQFAIPARFGGAGPFAEGLAPVQVGANEARRWGFIDRTGKFVIPPAFYGAWSFSEGRAAVQDATHHRHGYIDRTGMLVIPAIFTQADPFRDGLALASFNDKGHPEGRQIYIDRDGRYVATYRFAPARIPRPRSWTLRFRVVAPDGAPLAGAAVWVPEEDVGQTGVNGAPIAWTEIARGEYTAASQWIMWSVPSGRVTGPDGAVELGPRQEPVTYSCQVYHPDFGRASVHVDPKLHRPDAGGVVDLGDVRLPKGHIVRGRVLRPDGRPAAGATVACQPYRTRDVFSRRGDPDGVYGLGYELGVGMIRVTQTDGEGRYALKGLIRCRYLVAAWTDAHPPALERPDLRGAGAEDGGPAADRPWEERDVDFRLAEGTTVTVVARSGAAEGAPLAGAKVTIDALEPATIGFGRWSEFTTWEGATGADGRCVARGLPNGTSFRVWVTDPQGHRWCSGSTEPGATAIAVFRHGTLILTATGAAGEPVHAHWYGQCVESGRDDRSSWSRGVHPARFGHLPSRNGERVEIAGLPCGTWEMTVSAPGYLPQKAKIDVPPAGRTWAVRLEPGPGAVAGRVVDAVTREPVAGAVVWAGQDWKWDEDPAMRSEARTDASGFFRFTSLRGPGHRVNLKIDAPGYEGLRRDWMEDRCERDLGDVPLAPIGALHGAFIRGGAPAPETQAELWTPEGEIKYWGVVQSGPDGVWRREGLPAGRYLLATAGARREAVVVRGTDTDAGALDVSGGE